MKINALRYLIPQLEYNQHVPGFDVWRTDQVSPNEVVIDDSQYVAVHERIDILDIGNLWSGTSLNFEVRRGTNLKYYPFKRVNEEMDDTGDRGITSCLYLIVSDTPFQIIVDEMVHGPLFATPDAEIRSYMAESYRLQDFADEGHVHRYYKMPPMNILRPFLVTT